MALPINITDLLNKQKIELSHSFLRREDDRDRAIQPVLLAQDMLRHNVQRVQLHPRTP